MAKWYIIEKPDKSERCITQDKSGHEDWAELGTSTREPSDDEEWDRVSGDWKVDIQRKLKLKRAAKSQDLNGLLDRIEALEARLDAMVN